MWNLCNKKSRITSTSKQTEINIPLSMKLPQGGKSHRAADW